MAALDVTDATFKEQVLESDSVVLVDFWAAWCMPCQMLNPIIGSISDEMSDSAKFCKVNVDENKKIASEYNIMSIPAVYIFKDGKVVEELVGLRQPEDYKNALQKYIDE